MKCFQPTSSSPSVACACTRVTGAGRRAPRRPFCSFMGWPRTRASGIWLAPPLAHVFRVIALDQRGHGLSDTPDDGYDFKTITGDLARAIGALGWERPLVVGHSWGANVALQLAADYPALPSGVVLVDGGRTSWLHSCR